MPGSSLVRAFVIQWWAAGALLLFWSIRTAEKALQPGHAHSPHVALLGGAEAIAALLFLIPRTMRFGATGLLFTFAVAFLEHALQRQFRGDLLLYGAVVSYVAVHGAVPMAWLRPATAPRA